MTTLGYRKVLVLGACLLFAACNLWIVFGPETESLYPIKKDGELTAKGWIALLCGLPVFALSLPHAFHVLARRPALELDHDQLKIWMLPYQTIRLDEIQRIEVGDANTEIYLKDGSRRRINAAILDQPRYFFFDDLRSRLPDSTSVREKQEKS